MTPERFRVLLDTYGGDMRRWPKAERDAARALLAGDPAGLRVDHAEAARLDRDLDAHEIAAPGAALIERIAAPAGVGAPRASKAVVAARAVLATRRLGVHRSGRDGRRRARRLGRARRKLPAAATDWQKRGTAFTDRVADWSEE